MHLHRSPNEDKLNRLKSLEILSQNAPDEGFIKVFRPFRYVQIVLGTCRVDVHDRIIGAATVIQKCYSLVFLLLLMSSTLSLLQLYFLKKNVTDRFMNMLYTAGVFLLNFTCSVNVIHTRFLYNEEKVKFHIKMQQIDRAVEIKNLKMIDKRHYKYNVGLTTALIAATVFLAALTVIVTWGQVKIYEIFGPLILQSSFMIEMSCCSSHVKFFTDRVRFVNMIIADHFKNCRVGEDTLIQRCILLKKHQNVTMQGQDFRTSKTEVYMKEIFYGFYSFQENYRFQVFIFCVTHVLWIVLPFEYGILALKNNINMKTIFLDFLHISVVGCLQTIILFIICVRTQVFHGEIKTTKKLSVLVMSQCNEGPLRKKAKNMLNLIEEMSPCFSVYGMWQMDARLLLDMFSVVTSLLVTILQLAFL